MLKRGQGQLRRAGMAGLPTGLDLPALLLIGEDLGYDRRALALLLPMAEPGMLEAIHRRAADGAKE
ncbi:MAG: DUF7697 family protein [Inquilinus sp.]|uniref:DUF7697 family protein n=1 Tax=Inquilinus sp. TaxID=1932117 RepID=UPI003F3FC22E